MNPKKETKFVSKHKLDFLVSDYKTFFSTSEKWFAFKVGTCEGLFTAKNNSYQILAILNNEINNGHFEDVMQWFENSCKRDNYSLMFLEIWNKKFRKHLVSKRGFVMVGEFNAEKKFR